MIEKAARERFERTAGAGLDPATVRDLAAALKSRAFSAASDERLALAAPLAHVAFAAPERVGAIYDAACAGWTGAPVLAAPIRPLGAPALSIPAALWADFWPLIDDSANGRIDAGSITARTAALGGHVDPAYLARCAAAARLWPGVEAAAVGALPSRISLDALAACPAGSIGAQFHQLIVGNAFDLEVLDRDAIGLAALPAPLDWLNTRILQSHDLWHILAGYETTALHEIALSAFQLAQFGHAYSAKFLAVVATTASLSPPQGFGVIMDTFFTAWRHGRETPPLMTIPWETVWNESAEALRDRYAVRRYERPYPADLFEQLRAAA